MSNNLNVPVSREIARLVKARPRQCYQNSIRVILNRQNLLKHGITDEPFYCEGLCNPIQEMPFLWIEHAWVAVGGKIIDVTLNDAGAQKARYEEAMRLGYSDLSLWLAGDEESYPVAYSYSRETRRAILSLGRRLFFEDCKDALAELEVMKK